MCRPDCIGHSNDMGRHTIILRKVIGSQESVISGNDYHSLCVF